MIFKILQIKKNIYAIFYRRMAYIIVKTYLKSFIDI